MVGRSTRSVGKASHEYSSYCFVAVLISDVALLLPVLLLLLLRLMLIAYLLIVCEEFLSRIRRFVHSSCGTGFTMPSYTLP